jgi:3-phenylpropionate/trans-cinnamate dioxygenase ferredoxin component
MPWKDAISVDDIPSEEARRFDHGGRTYLLVRNHQDEFFCLDGMCTHESVHLCDGLVIENTIECPKHSSIFNIATGEVETPPACENLRTYPVQVDGGRLLVDLP